MRIKRLSLTNWLCHEHLEAEFRRPVNLVVGQNEVGKTAVRDAIEFAFLGMARGIPYKRDAHMLTRLGSTGMAVEVELADPDIVIRRTSKTVKPSASDINKLFKPEILGACIDAFGFLSKSRKERAVVLGSFSTANIDQVQKALADAGLNGRELGEMVTLASEDLGKAEKVAVERRRAAKRLRDAEHPQAPREVEVGGKRYDLQKLSAKKEALFNRIHELQQEEGKLTMARGVGGSTEMLNKQLEDINQRLASLQTKLTMVNRNTFELSEKAVNDWNAELARQIAKLDKLSIVAVAAGNECALCDFIACPLDSDHVRQQLSAYKEAVEDTQSRLTEAREEHLKLVGDKQTAQDMEQLSNRRKVVEHELAKVAEFKGEEALASVRQKLALNRELKVHLDKYDRAQARKGEAAEQAKQRIAEVELWDKVAGCCAPNGLLSKLLADTVTPDVIALAAKKHLFADGRKLDVRGDGTVILDGIASEFLSKSEKLRVGVLITHSLASLAGFRLLVIDEADMLTPINRKLLLGFLGAVRNSYDTILVLASEGDRPPRPSPNDWLDVWRLDKQGIRLVGGEGQ